jgi:hypothetical protein
MNATSIACGSASVKAEQQCSSKAAWLLRPVVVYYYMFKHAACAAVTVYRL